MIKILSVDTCLNSCSVAVSCGESLVSEIFLNTGLTHSETLMTTIKSTLFSANLKPEDIDVFGVTNGPGSFTGIRIGMATVKGMAIAFDKPCIAVSSLFALALKVSFTDAIVCSCIDARNNQIYNAIFESNSGKIKRVTKNRAIYIDDFIKEIRGIDRKIIFVGDAAKMCYNTARDNLKAANLLLPPEDFHYIRASNVAEEVLSRYKEGSCVQKSQSILPEYIKVSQAQRQLEEKRKEDIKF